MPIAVTNEVKYKDDLVGLMADLHPNNDLATLPSIVTVPARGER
jgi:hypothetical protein